MFLQYKRNGIESVKAIRYKGVSLPPVAFRRLYKFLCNCDGLTALVAMVSLLLGLCLVCTLVLVLLFPQPMYHHGSFKRNLAAPSEGTRETGLIEHFGLTLAAAISVLVTGLDSPPTNDPTSIGFWVWQSMALAGLLVRSAVAALLFVRLSKPSTNVTFSRWCIVGTHGVAHSRSLEFRVSTQRLDVEMIAPRVEVALSLTPRTGPPRRRYTHLELQQASHALLPYVTVGK